MSHQSMEGYFEHIKNKTYIDRYPRTIIRLEDLKEARILEFGAGIGNDIRFLIESLGVDPKNLFFIESDVWYLTDALDALEDLFEEMDFHFFPGDILENCYPDGFVDFVYANNFLHCLGYRVPIEEVVFPSFNPANKLRLVIREAYRLISNRGVFFGRALSSFLDVERLVLLERKAEKSEDEKFVLSTARELREDRLIGIDPKELKSYGYGCGFSHCYIEDKEDESWKPIKDFYFRFEK